MNNLIPNLNNDIQLSTTKGSVMSKQLSQKWKQPMKDQNEPELIINFALQNQESLGVQRSAPWYIEKTRKLRDPILRMHNEAIDFYLFSQPSKQQQQSNIALFQNISHKLQQMNENILIVYPFLYHSLYLKGTEPDMYVLVPHLNEQFAQKLRQNLSQSMTINILPETNQKYEIHQIQVECEGKIMVIRMLDRLMWEEYMAFIDQSLAQILQIKFIYCIFSCMIRQRWMNLSIRPYFLFALISVFYHERRKHKVRTLTENIIKFIEYYGVGPFQERRINYLGKNRYELIQEGPSPTPFSLWINEKVNISNHYAKQFFNILKNRYRLISNFNFDEEQTIIGLLVNPCKKQFSY